MRFLYLLAGLSALVGAAATGGCTVIVHSDSVQCSADSDCGATAVCEQNRCVEKPECATTQDCVNAFGYEYNPDDPATETSVFAKMAGFGVPVAATVDENAAGERPFKKLKVPARICAVGKCVSIRNDGDAQCAVDASGRQLVFGDPNTPKPVVIGFLGDITNRSAQSEVFDPKFTQESDDIRAAALPLILARRELPQFNDLLLVGCSQQRNASLSAEPATRHLLDLGAKAIIGPTVSIPFEQAARLTADVLEPAGRVTKPGIPLFGPWVLNNSAAAVSGTNGLLFFPGPFASEVLPPLNEVLANRERALIASGKLAPGEQLRVMVYIFSTAAATASDRPFIDSFGLRFDEYRVLEPLLLANLRFNGLAASEQGANYRVFNGAGSNETKKRFVDEAIAFKPHIVIPFSGFFEWLPMLKSERNDGLEDKLTLKPTYIHPMVSFEETYSVNDYFRNNTNDILSRMTGTRPTKSAAFLAFQQEFAKDFGVEQATLNFKLGLGRAYDSALLLLYGLYAARANQTSQGLLEPKDFTGRDLARAIVDKVAVPGGRAIDANPASFTTGVSVINNGLPIRLGGIQSTLVFDQIGHAPVNWESWCVDPTVSRNVTNRTFEGDGKLAATPSRACSGFGL